VAGGGGGEEGGVAGPIGFCGKRGPFFLVERKTAKATSTTAAIIKMIVEKSIVKYFWLV